MSRSSKIVKFTFWMNNLVYLFLAIAYIFAFTLNIQIGVVVAILAIVGIFLVVIFQSWYLKNKLQVKSLKDAFWFVDDEREKDFSMEIAAKLIGTASSALMLLFAFTTFMTIFSNFDPKVFASALIIAIIVSMYYLNIRYYQLWNKLAKD